jgi:hypothetical protein
MPPDWSLALIGNASGQVAGAEPMRGAKAQESQVEDLFDDKLLDLTVFDKRILQDTVIPCLATEYRIRAIKKEQTG